ncbi:NACHT domain-containing protein [Streptomyces sp. M19]
MPIRTNCSGSGYVPPPRAPPEDAAFERRYRDYVVDRYSELTVVGLDLGGPEAASWPLDTAYLSLELAEPAVPLDGRREGMVPVRVERADQAFSGRQRTLVRGLAGSGKTTLLQWLAVTGAQQEPQPVPFVLALRTLVRGDSCRGRRTSSPPPAAPGGCPAAGWADRVLAEGRGLLLVDGIDEVPQQQRERTREWLRELLAAYRHSRFVVTTRPSAVPEGWLAGLKFAELTVRPMSRQDVSVFISRWHAAAGCDLEESLKDAVRSQRDLAQLATTPLMCALMCALHRDRRGHLPQGRMELYEAALSMLLVRRDRERDIGAPEGVHLNHHQSVQLLQRLAYWLIRNGQAEMDRRPLSR